MAICGSPHIEGFSPSLLKSAAEGTREAGADVEVVILGEKRIKSCLACPNPPCWTSMNCNIKDDDGLLLRKLFNECDALIISAPVYFLTINGLTKDFLDRMRHYGANGKPAFPISAAGGTGKGCVKALQDLSVSLTIFDFRVVMPLPATRYNAEEALAEARKRGKRLVEEYGEKKPFANLADGYAWLYSQPYMDWDLIDELLYLTRIAIEGIRKKGREDLASQFVEELSALEKNPENIVERIASLHERTMQVFNTV
ncbi:MAG: flavodoxin family protein [bacterium]